MEPINMSFFFTIGCISTTVFLVIVGLLSYRFSDLLETRGRNWLVKVVLLFGILVATYVALEATGTHSQEVHAATIEYIRIVKQ